MELERLLSFPESKFVRLTSSYIMSRSDHNLAWEGNWNNVRQRVEEELVRARSGRFKYDFDGNGEFRYPRGTRGSGGGYPAALPGSRVDHYQHPWQGQDASGGQGSRHRIDAGQGSHYGQNFHNHPDPVPYPTRRSGASRAIPTAIMGKTSTIILTPFPTQHVTLDHMEGLGEGHKLETSPRADRATLVKVVVLGADPIVTEDAMICHTVDSTTEPPSRRLSLSVCGSNHHITDC